MELRLKIWKGALPESKFIEIQSPGETPDDRYDATTWKAVCKEVAPALFFVCKESNGMVMKTYKPLRGSEEGSQAIWCDLDRDEVCFSCQRFNVRKVATVIEEHISRGGQPIKHIAIDYCICGVVWTEVAGTKVLKLLRELELKEIIITSDTAIASPKLPSSLEFESWSLTRGFPEGVRGVLE